MAVKQPLQINSSKQQKIKVCSELYVQGMDEIKEIFFPYIDLLFRSAGPHLPQYQ
jgi:hypothetical protein